jgi:hypothetical protein
MTKTKTPKAEALYIASNKPGGYLPSEQLDRANAFASMRIALGAALDGDRNNVTAAIREAVVSFAPEFASHRNEILQAAVRAEATGRIRDLENIVAAKVNFFAYAESATLGTAPQHADADTIQARNLLEANTARASQYRVRHYLD